MLTTPPQPQPLSLLLLLFLLSTVVVLSSSSNQASRLSFDLALKTLGYLDNSLPEGKNSFLSPLSATVALGMLYEGTSGLTKRSMQEALGLTQDDNQVREAFKVSSCM